MTLAESAIEPALDPPLKLVIMNTAPPKYITTPKPWALDPISIIIVRQLFSPLRANTLPKINATNNSSDKILVRPPNTPIELMGRN
ncbi:MAG: hypothetical protein KJO79_03190 [Verrucomicrobiae bacterium]|nr:hypothetical protein [Verrucomicrobiae bacterium]NNJ86160.1 hypothetical protein [Akkermansiaceae bacterium]